MNENTKKYTQALSSLFVILAAIASLTIGGLKLVNMILTLISSGGILSAVFAVLNLALYVLLGIGLLFVYKNAKKEQISSTGAMLIRVPVMILGIASFAVYTLAILAILIVGFIFMAASFSYDALTGFGILLVVLLILAFSVMCAIAVLRLSTAINSSFKGFVNGDDKLIKTKGVTFSAIFLLVLNILGVVGSIIQLVALDMIMSAVNGLFSPRGQFDGIMKEVLSMLGISDFYIIQGIIGIVVCLLICTLYICCMQFFKSFREEENAADFSTRFSSLAKITHEEEKAEQEDFDDDNHDTVMLKQSEVKGQILSLSGQDRGYAYPICEGEVITIGKDAKMCSIVVPVRFQKISRKHCAVRYFMGNYEVIDFSTNGTFLNNTQKLEKGVYVSVPKGTTINLGKENVSFKLG